MSAILGSGSFKYEALDKWEKLPEGVGLTEVPSVAVDSQDVVYVMTRNKDHPVIVLDRDGNFQRSFGQGVFSERTHGILIGRDDSVYCAGRSRQNVGRWQAHPHGDWGWRHGSLL